MKNTKLMLFFVGMVALISIFAPGGAFAQEADPPLCCIDDPIEFPPPNVAILDDDFVWETNSTDFVALAPEFFAADNRASLLLPERFLHSSTIQRNKQA